MMQPVVSCSLIRPMTMPVRMSHSSGPVKKTPFNSLHKELGGKMIEFFGWEMPVQFPTGVMGEVALCRNGAAVFDVSHMGQLKVYGSKRIDWVERMTVADVKNLPENNIKLSIIPNEKGCTVDDTMVTKCKDHLYIIVNSACYDKDMKHFKKYLSEFPGVRIENLYDTHAMIAIQGPASEEAMKTLLDKDKAAYLDKMPFMTRMVARVAGCDDCVISRSGYTGEDGFEISVPRKNAIKLGRALCNAPNCGPAGLGSRDTLRLEAALSLYGQDLDDKSTLVEAGLNWVVPKRRRQEGGFLGASVILKQMKEGVAKKRVGLIVDTAPAREHAPVLSVTGKEIGVITSGGPAPTIGKNVALATVPTEYSSIGTKLKVKVRGKAYNATVTKQPFVPHRYKKDL
ncbi:glycine cleavage system T protein, mitochondrial [Pelomyxa schiedti]|nr:glycine cleavage system T protein, mitochondrial [Pelomyxa schiedti]